MTDTSAGAIALDDDWYRRTYRLEPGVDPAQHFADVGHANLLAPRSGFAPLRYLAAHSEDLDEGLDPYAHANEQDAPRYAADPAVEAHRAIYSPDALARARAFFEFDADFYTRKRPIRARRSNPEDHYRQRGEEKGFWPSPFFDPEFYRDTYARQLADWRGSTLDHFLQVGIFLGNFPCFDVAEGATLAGHDTVIEWVAHWEGWTQSGIVTPRASDERVAGPRPQTAVPARATTARRRVLHWVIPAFASGSGGHTTIFRAVRTLQRCGWSSVIWVDGVSNPDRLRKLAVTYLGGFPTTGVEFRGMDASFEEIEDEFLVATAWRTAYTVSRNVRPNVRLYFVQDWESHFYGMGAESILAAKTYDLGFDFVTAGPWLASLVAGRGGDVTTFELCADPELKATDPPLAERPVLAAVYIRSHTPRRASTLMIEAANQIADAGVGEVVVFGDGKAGLPLRPNVRNLGVLARDEMAALLQRSRFGLVASATNYSILPVEMAAAGCIVVQPDTESTELTVGARGAHTTEFSADALADFVLRHAGMGQEEFDQLRTPYRDFAVGLSWEEEFTRLSDWLDERVAPDAPQNPRESAAIVVPTYYPTALLERIVEAVAAQLTSYDTVIQLIDSRKDGRVSAVVDKVAASGGVKLHVIDAAYSPPGDPRRLGDAVAAADHYVYLTDDAVPADEYWLESLLAPLTVLSDVAYSFGRHRAHPEHHVLYDEELDRHFGGVAEHGYVTNLAEHAEQIAEQPRFRATLAFNSDNNAAYRGSLLRQHRFPSVPFAEDQAMARDLLDLGYSRAYAPASVVYHSHDYSAELEVATKRGREECESFYRNFGLVLIPDATRLRTAIRRAERLASLAGARRGLDRAATLGVLTGKVHSLLGAWVASQQFLAEHPEARD